MSDYGIYTEHIVVMNINTIASLEFFYSANSNAPYLSGEHACLQTIKLY
jgi:hypothetical protein